MLVGLFITLTAIITDSWYVTRQIVRLREVQSNVADRSRRDSLQLLRIQNDLNALGLAMRDMLDNDEPYLLTAWSPQFERIRTDLTDALKHQDGSAVVARTPEQRRALASSSAQFWDAVDRMFALANAGRSDDARAQIRLSLQARQAALVTAVARLLVENNRAEDDTARQVQDIYDQVQRQVYVFLAATTLIIALTSLYLIRHNRLLFARLSALADSRRELARQLITTREATLRHVARELHDELGQTLTAMGSMLARAGRHVPEDSAVHAEIREASEVGQIALENVRSLSQTLHPSILDQAGLESAIDWYVTTVKRQSGIDVSYESSGAPAPVDTDVAIHVYRILQEALTNVIRHSGARTVHVGLTFRPDSLLLVVEDRGRGFSDGASRPGLGIITMRERAEVVGATLELLQPAEGGTKVRLTVPLPARPAIARAE